MSSSGIELLSAYDVTYGQVTSRQVTLYRTGSTVRSRRSMIRDAVASYASGLCERVAINIGDIERDFERGQRNGLAYTGLVKLPHAAIGAAIEF